MQFNFPARSVRYMIWRKKKKYPVYGGCKSRLIRRRIKNPGPNNPQSKKMKFHNNTNSKFIKTSDPLQPTQEETKEIPNNMDFIISKNTEDKKEMSGTDSSATVVSPKSVFLDPTSDRNDFSSTEVVHDCGEVGAIDALLLQNSSPSKRRSSSSCDIAKDSSCSRSVLLQSPPASSIRRSPTKLVCESEEIDECF